MNKNNIRYSELSGWVKLGIIGGWTTVALFILGFIAGFFGIE